MPCIDPLENKTFVCEPLTIRELSSRETIVGYPASSSVSTLA
jgi:hypothetical protein